MPSAVRERAPAAADRYPWTWWARRSGDEGRRWCARYAPYRPLADTCQTALELLRRRDASRGLALLAEAADRLNEAAPEPSIRNVLNRWYFGALAYGRYAEGDFDGADRCMVAAHDAVAAALAECPFLMPLANHAQEFRLHRARIARNRCRWAEMHAHVAHARAMVTGAVELCVLPGGGEVWMGTLKQFFTSLSGVTPDALQSVRGITDDARRLLLFDQFVQVMYRLEGFVIPCPGEPDGAVAGGERVPLGARGAAAAAV